MKLINWIFSYLYSQQLPLEKEDIFLTQKNVMQRLLIHYASSPLYRNLHLKQEKIKHYNSHQLKEYLASYRIVDYGADILSLVEQGSWITASKPDLHIKTSGTSDAQQWGKLIPAQRSSFHNERQAIQRTLAYYLKENPQSKVFLPYSFVLSAPFDTSKRIGYISGAMRYGNKFVESTLLPSSSVLRTLTNQEKKEKIIQELCHKKPNIRSFHGVPARPLWVIDELIERDAQIARQILSRLEYISIGWWTPQDYKLQYKKRLESLWLRQKLYGSNNHNASEGFFGAQTRNFEDLSFHAMVPLYRSNFFLFVGKEEYQQRKSWQRSTSDMIMMSHLLHEVQSDQEYFMLFANDRIPRLYDIKDKVKFSSWKVWDPLEYEVVGRYSMSSNIMNEHIESDVLQQVISELDEQWYQLNAQAFVAGMEVNEAKTSAQFHIIIEWAITSDKEIEQLTRDFDVLLGKKNEQRKFFRERNTRITDCHVVIVADWFIRSTMMILGLWHEQSKIPYLSDWNYESIVKPLLHYEKRVR